MIVHKFGGAAVKDIESIKAIPELLKCDKYDRAFIVVSAMGKTTNKIEEITNSAYYNGNYNGNYNKLINELYEQHEQVLKGLVYDEQKYKQLKVMFEDFRKTIVNTDKTNYNFFYDQVVSFGERFSSFIVFEYLKSIGLDIRLLDANQIFTSDSNYRAGNINIDKTKEKLTKIIAESDNEILMTQGFIAADDKGKSVTIGREGSDYSASLIANCIAAEKLFFWKDVEGIFSADPKLFDDAVKIDKISYEEMIELSYFGAKVLHHNTLYALKEKNINLQVRSFLTPEKIGTTLYNDEIEIEYPPIKILLDKQILFTVEPIEKKLIGVEQIQLIYKATADYNLNINLIQISATKLSFCADYDKFNCEALFEALTNYFNVKYNTNVAILSLRHYKKNDIEQFENNNDIILSQINRTVAQYVIEM